MVIFDLAPMNYACCSFGSIEPFWNLSEPKRGYTPYRHQTDIRGVPVGGVGLRGAVTAGEWLYSRVTSVSQTREMESTGAYRVSGTLV